MNTAIPQRLAALRSVMKEKGVYACLIPTDDFHLSEYVGDYFKCRKYITGFTGSAGTAVILLDEAGLWTDGRYFLQAADQLEGSSITLYRMGEPGVPSILEFLEQKLPAGAVLAFDGRCVSAAGADELEERLSSKSIQLMKSEDLAGEIWTDRPALSCEPAWELPVEYAGKSRKQTISELRTTLARKKVDFHIITSLDDIAWLLNIRGSDVHCNPVVLSYLILSQDQLLLFAGEKAFSPELKNALMQDGVSLLPYGEVYSCAQKLPENARILLNRKKVNSLLVASLPKTASILDEENPVLLAKAVKNETEIRHMREAHIKDGAALTRFIYWLKKTVRDGGETVCLESGEQKKVPVTELSAEKKLYELRSMQEHFLGNSFDPIISYGSHAAIVHYSATEESNIPLEPRDMVLADTGGQYLEGTTDVTRTIVLGPVTEEEKKYFTAVLRGHLNLGSARFLHGCTGQNLDILARGPLWDMGEDYNHGTGHGVGYLLNVHEAPNGFRWKPVPERNDRAVLEAGMITSDAPGYYRAGAFGIRHENLILCQEAEKTGSGQFLCFDYLTMVPFDREGIDPSLMTGKELDSLNAYHERVWETISPYLEGEERDWLREVTLPL